MTKIAPIVVFAYNRSEHLKETVEQLKLCQLAKESELYVFSDGPKEKGDDTVNQVREYIRQIEGFKNIKSHFGEVNLGLANSIIKGLNQVFEDHDYAIVLEDDMLVGEHFLSYHNEGLKQYTRQEKVYCISGYAYDIRSHDSPYFLPTSSNQAWSTWKSKWEKINFDNPNIDKLSNRWTRFKFNEYGAINYSKRLRETVENKTSSSWAILLKWHLFTSEGLTLFPSNNLVENIGWDGSGTNCSHDNPYEEDIRSTNHLEAIFPTEIFFKRIDFFSLILFHYRKRIKASLKYRFAGGRRNKT